MIQPNWQNFAPLYVQKLAIAIFDLTFIKKTTNKQTAKIDLPAQAEGEEVE